MPNPRITFRCPEDLYAQLPIDERERSRLLLQLLEDYYSQQTPEDKVSQLSHQVEQLLRRVADLEQFIPQNKRVC